MAIIHLHGYLGEKYGTRFELSVHSAAEAVRLLNANFRGFTADLLKHKAGFLVRSGDEHATDVAGLRAVGISPEIHITPVIAGAGGNNNGLTQIIMAVVIVSAAYYGNFSPTTTSAMYSMGANLAISGVSSMLFSQKAANTDATELTGETNLANYAFNGPVNTTAQGNPVPVLYGRLRVGSQVISAGISSV